MKGTYKVLTAIALVLTVSACSSTTEVAQDGTQPMSEEKSITKRAQECQETGSRVRSRC